jgi:uncharacterized protein YqhQ
VAEEKLNVGGQAVMEGVMMRSPNIMVVAVRKQNQEIVLKEGEPWRLFKGRYSWLKWPFIRGIAVLIEAMVNGIDALMFSANQALDEGEEEELSSWAIAGTILFAFGFAILLFVAVPHFLSWLLGRISWLDFGVESLAFHSVDGLIKLAVFLLYIYLIGRIKDIGRVFEYHGAEHKSIFTYEAGRELTVENARGYSTLHPRCGTAFLIVVLMISIVLFAVVFPLFIPKSSESGWLMHLAFVGVKILLMFPIAGAAYEFNRLASRKMDHWLLKLAVLPGLWVQKLTTREPSDDQIEIAEAALEKALALEGAREAS